MDENKEIQEQGAQTDSFIKKIFKNITLEPLFICYFLPYSFGWVFIENLSLEKSCRDNINRFTNITNDICQLFVRKQQYNISCESITTTSISEDILDVISLKHSNIFELVKNNVASVVQAICDVEDETQVQLAHINKFRNPIASIGPLIIILFAAGWSDKKGRRIPCMLLPYLGEAFGFFSLFVSAYFMNEIPVEVPTYLYRLIPSITGAESLMLMGAFSYIAANSSEENRFFRFGIFQIVVSAIPFIGQVSSATLFDYFSYTEFFGWCLPVFVIGFLYVIYFIKEVKTPITEKDGIDNPACEIESTDNIVENQNALEKKKNFCAEFFDPELPIHCIKVFLKKRDSPIRIVLILIVITHFLNIGVIIGEITNLSLLIRSVLNADVTVTSYLNAYNIALGVLGMSLMIGFNKILKVKDITIILITSCLTIISKLIYVQSSTTLDYFIGATVDFCGAAKFTASKNLVSKLVPTSELSSLYAIMGIVEPVASFVFPPLYSEIYSQLIKDQENVGIVYKMTCVFLVFSLVLCLIIFKLLRSRKIGDIEENKQEVTKANQVEPNNIELTKL